MIGFALFAVLVRMISLQLKSNQFITIELKPAHFNE